MKRAKSKGMGICAMRAGAAALFSYVFLIRPWHMKWGATQEDVDRPMAGDEEVKQPIHVTTRTVTIKARPEEIWPWLVQMGYGRGGMYSYDWLDRVMGILDKKSTRDILPEHQHLEVGDVIPMGSGPSWPVTALEPMRCLVLHIEDPGVDITWSYLLEPAGDEWTRVVLRIRSWLKVRVGMIPLLAVMDPGEFLMVRKHLLGIKERAEMLAAGRTA